MNILDQSTILKVLRNSGIITLNYSFKDVRYVILSDAQVDNEIAPEFKARLPEMGLQVYQPEKGDCDDSAYEARCLVRRFWRKTRGSIDAGIAFGEMDYLRRDGILHEINFYVTMISGKFVLRFWEPQTQLRVELLETEIELCEWLAV